MRRLAGDNVIRRAQDQVGVGDVRRDLLLYQRGIVGLHADGRRHGKTGVGIILERDA